MVTNLLFGTSFCLFKPSTSLYISPLLLSAGGFRGFMISSHSGSGRGHCPFLTVGGDEGSCTCESGVPNSLRGIGFFGRGDCISAISFGVFKFPKRPPDVVPLLALPLFIYPFTNQGYLGAPGPQTTRSFEIYISRLLSRRLTMSKLGSTLYFILYVIINTEAGIFRGWENGGGGG